MERMAENGTATFANPDDYQAGIGGASVNLIVTGSGDFKARLTWLNLRRLHVLRASESLPRIGFISLSPAQAFVSFPTCAGPPLTYGGLGLQFGDVVFHSRGERMHQRTNGESQWGLISLPPGQLAACGKALAGLRITSPPVGRVLRPSRSAASRLLCLHSRACRLAETRHELIANPEVARALEQELLHALVNCLMADDGIGNLKTRRHHADIMVRFEDALTAHLGRQLNMPALCLAIGVPERTLRVCCTEFLGMSPTRYLLLRRLNMARSALRRADPETASVAEIARTYQFREPGRFAVTYRAIFGEMPSSTLRRKSIKNMNLPKSHSACNATCAKSPHR
jgi:AraC-like DNA-binding protein